MFITAYDQYALEAFEQGVFDYVLKPAERERLQVTVQRLRAPGCARHADGRATRAGCRRCCRLAASCNPAAAPQLPALDPGHGRPADPDDPGRGRAVLHLRREVHARADRDVEALIRKPIKELVEELDPQLFWQIHRSTLVNARAIAGVTSRPARASDGGVQGHPEKLEVSRSYAHLFKGM